jgi:metallo-beta-lactamase family protein
MTVNLEFHGAAETVTGSRYLIESATSRVLVDCGLFQGYKSLRLRNWEAPSFDPAGIDAVVLTHAHLDHSGWLPRLQRLGYRGPIYCSESTLALCRILLKDAARLQEEDASYANVHGFSRHSPALPLFEMRDVEEVLAQFRPVAVGSPIDIGKGALLRLQPAGHLLGAASAHLRVDDKSVFFSGDVGRSTDLIMPPPARTPAADYLVIESTYGNRQHVSVNAEGDIAAIVARVAARGGVVVIPSFAVGRAQVVLLLLSRLRASGRLPRLPVFLDSPMAISATELYLARKQEHRLTAEECSAMKDMAHLVRTAEESRTLGRRTGPMVIIAGSGMATGGRVLHHIKTFAPDPRNAILLTGYQAGGTRGARLVAGERTLRIHGQDVEVRAEVAQLESLSAHADADELLKWLREGDCRPSRAFVTHGDPDAADTFRARLKRELGWDAIAPKHGDRFAL